MLKQLIFIAYLYIVLTPFMSMLFTIFPKAEEKPPSCCPMSIWLPP